jgi:2-iminoacetate synthase
MPSNALMQEASQLARRLPPAMAAYLGDMLSRMAADPDAVDVERLDRFRRVVLDREEAGGGRLAELLDLAAVRLRGLDRPPRAAAGVIAGLPAAQLAAFGAREPVHAARDILTEAAAGGGLEPEQAACLLHPRLDPAELLEAAGAAGRRLTGGRIELYAPLYLSNECVNNCVYCGFQLQNRAIVRRTLSVEEAVAEARVLSERGLRRLLLVAAEGPPSAVNVAYLQAVLRRLAVDWPAIDVEIGPLSVGRYAAIAEAGAGGVTVYQETYDRGVYAGVHRGPKSRYDYRIETAERAIDAGLRRIGIGVLLGLAEPVPDLLWLIAHARYLETRYPHVRLALSLPRCRPEGSGYVPAYPVDDGLFVRLFAVARLALPQAELVVSTREAPEMRERLLRIGATRLSAGSSTRPGGYVLGDASGEQFEIADRRPVEQVAEVIRAAGFEPGWRA